MDEIILDGTTPLAHQTEVTVDAQTGVPMDGKNRYLIPDPNIGEWESDSRERKSWQRCTTLADILSDRFGLEIHEQNNIILGLGARPDLRDLTTVVTRDDVVGLRELRREARSAGAADAKANQGTFFHELSRPLDHGAPVAEVAARLDTQQLQTYLPMLHAYVNALRRYGVEMPDTELGIDPTEVVVHDPRIGIAGRLDKVRRIYGRNVIVDVKTGENPLKYSAVAYAMQLAILAHAPLYWLESEGRHVPAIPVDREIAYLLHVPTGGDHAELIAVDIAQAWRWVMIALQVRHLRQLDHRSFTFPLGRIGAQDGQLAPLPAPVLPWAQSFAAAVAVGMPAVPVEQPAANQLATSLTPAPVTTYRAPDAGEVRVLVQGGYVPPAATPSMAAPVPAAPSAPGAAGHAEPRAPESPATAGGEQQDTAVPPIEPAVEPEAKGKRKPRCARCRRPGHQTRTCRYITTEDGGAINDGKTVDLINAGTVADKENLTAEGGIKIQATIERVERDPSGTIIIDGQAVTPAEADRILKGPSYCTCTSFPEGSGWSNRGDQVWVHNICGLPSFSATQRALAVQVLNSPGGDPGGMASQALQFFTAHPDFNPPAERMAENGWPPPPYTPPATHPSNHAGVASVTPTTALASPPVGTTTGHPTSTAAPATAASATPMTAPSTPGGTSASSLPPTTPTAAPAVSSSPPPPPASTAAPTWVDQLLNATTLDELGRIVQDCVKANAWNSHAANAANRRNFELQRPPGQGT